MNKNLKKSLFVGMAALGFVTAASSINANNASAKSYAKVTSNKWIGTSSDNNVVLNGSNALYTKAGTLKGAKKVASTTTLKKLAKSKSSEDNFVAYRVATTNRGSVYYKVVSLDKSYRGWIYGGKSTTTMAGGVTPFTTFKQGTVNSTDAAKSFKFKKVGTTNDGTMLTYKDPMYTIYGSGRQITDSTQYANDSLTITKQGTRTREGDQWVYVEDANNSTVNGWILRSGLDATAEIPASQGVTLKYVDNNGATVKSQVVAFPGTTETANVTDQAKKNVPEGYTYATVSSNATAAKKGDTVTVTVNQNVKTKSIDTYFRVAANDNGSYPTINGKVATNATDLWSVMSAAQRTAYTTSAAKADFQILTGSTLASADTQKVIADAGLTSFTFKGTDGKTTYAATLKSVADLKVAQNVTNPHPTAYYTVTVK